MKVRSDGLPPSLAREKCPKQPERILVRLRENAAPYAENHGEQSTEGYEYDEYTLELPSYCGEEWLTANFDSLLAQAKTLNLEKEAVMPENIMKIRSDVDTHETTTDDVIEYAAENDYRICLLELGLTPEDL